MQPMKPLSEQLADMSAAAKSVEDAAAQARREGRERVDAMVADARANADAVSKEVDQHISDTQDAMASSWHDFQSRVRSDVESMKAEMAARKYDREADRAAANAAAAERRAEYAVAVATMAIWNAQETVLEAISARAEAESY